MWSEFKITPGRAVFAVLATVAMMGIMTYLNLSFKEADIKTAISLVESAKSEGVTLRERMETFLPNAKRFCEARTLSEFYGHMEVSCKDLSLPAHLLVWNVNLSDGMVIPTNDAAMKLGKGVAPWEK